MKLISGTVLQSATRFTVKVLVVAAATVGGGALVSSSVFASLTAVATGSTSVEAGTLKWEMTTGSSSAGFSTGISGVAPGDIQNRYVDLANTGTLTGLTPTLTIVASGSGASALTNILKVRIQNCAVAWSAGVCSSPSDVLGTALVPVSVSAVTASLLSNLSASVAGTNKLKITLTVGDVTEVTTNGVVPTGIQGATSTLAWTFTLQQRAAITTEG